MTAASPIRNPLWAMLRAQEAPTSVADLARALEAPASTIGWRLSRWARSGLLTAIKPANDAPAGTRYIMPASARAHTMPPALDAVLRPSAKRGGRAAMWRAIRVKKRFDLVELVVMAEVSVASAKVYVSALLRAGNLICRFLLEMRNVPFREQEFVLNWIVARVPNFCAGKMDWRGNGQSLAEFAQQRWGFSRIEAVKTSDQTYRRVEQTRH